MFEGGKVITSDMTTDSGELWQAERIGLAMGVVMQVVAWKSLVDK